jgi:hypothetical protein
MTEQHLAPHKIALALQGGGSHGAFTWGVLDRMLDDPAIKIVGATGKPDSCAATETHKERPRRSGLSELHGAFCQRTAFRETARA